MVGAALDAIQVSGPHRQQDRKAQLGRLVVEASLRTAQNDLSALEERGLVTMGHPAAIFTSLNHPAGIRCSSSQTIWMGRSPDAETHRTGPRHR